MKYKVILNGKKLGGTFTYWVNAVQRAKTCRIWHYRSTPNYWTRGNVTFSITSKDNHVEVIAVDNRNEEEAALAAQLDDRSDNEYTL